jgi:hypothetical protein
VAGAASGEAWLVPVSVAGAASGEPWLASAAGGALGGAWAGSGVIVVASGVACVVSAAGTGDSVVAAWSPDTPSPMPSIEPLAGSKPLTPSVDITARSGSASAVSASSSAGVSSGASSGRKLGLARLVLSILERIPSPLAEKALLLSGTIVSHDGLE